MDMPPFTRKIRSNFYFPKPQPQLTNINSPTGTQARHLRQSLSIQGCGTPSFAEVIDDIGHVHALFDCVIEKDKLQACSIVGQYGEEPIIQMSNRYFTPLREDPAGPQLTFGPDIDPHGHLTRAGGSQLVYGEDNQVHYFQQTKTMDGDAK